MSTAIRVKNLAKRFEIGERGSYRLLRDVVATKLRTRFFTSGNPRASRSEEIWALNGVSFEVAAGQIVGIIGRNGAGKTTLLKVLARITPPSRGEVELFGRVGALLEVGVGLHGELTGRENIYLSGAVLGMSRQEIRRELESIINFAEVGPFLDTPLKQYSTGMQMRLAFSVAAHLEPEILLVDEVLAVGDARFQRKCLFRLEEIGRTGRTIVFVSHDIPSVLRLCDRLILLEHGVVIADGVPEKVAALYLSAGSGRSSERVWNDVESAPGDAVARMKAVRVLSASDHITEVVDVGEACSIEIEYWRLQRGGRSVAALSFFNDQGVCLFASSAFGHQTLQGGAGDTDVVRSKCGIPAHLLAEGIVFVHAAVVTYGYPSTIHATEKDAVSFQVVDRRGSDPMREHYAGRWPGVVRPKLEWHVG